LNSSLWNATVTIYDPYAAKIVDILEFPGIAHNPLYHIGGVGVDKKTGLLSIVVDAGDAFNTAGQDISGTNYIMQWDPKTKEVLYELNLTKTSQGKYGGFQDVEQDPEGNVYVVGTYPGSIMRVDKKGKTVTPWYVSEPIITTQTGLSGLAAKDWILLSNDVNSGQIWRFDMREKKGVPVIVPLSPSLTVGFSDAIYLPPKYKGTVLLVAEDFAGIRVLRSTDGKWESAEYLGLVPWTDSNVFVTASVQVGEGLYMVLEPFGDVTVPGTSAGPRSEFPFVDITQQVEALLAA
jgi:hypothetical protein